MMWDDELKPPVHSWTAAQVSLPSELESVRANRETVLSELRNALMANDAIDPMKQGALSVSKDLTCVGARIRKAIMLLEGKRP